MTKQFLIKEEQAISVLNILLKFPAGQVLDAIDILRNQLIAVDVADSSKPEEPKAEDKKLKEVKKNANS